MRDFFGGLAMVKKKFLKRGLWFFGINDAQFGVNNFNVFLHYQLWLRTLLPLFNAAWHFDILSITDMKKEKISKGWEGKKSLMNEVVTCALVLIKIVAALSSNTKDQNLLCLMTLASKNPTLIFYQNTDSYFKYQKKILWVVYFRWWGNRLFIKKKLPCFLRIESLVKM